MKTYNFILEPQDSQAYGNRKPYDLDTNPYSGIHNAPISWARMLLKLHPKAQRVLYKREGGRKVYVVTR